MNPVANQNIRFSGLKRFPAQLLLICADGNQSALRIACLTELRCGHHTCMLHSETSCYIAHKPVKTCTPSMLNGAEFSVGVFLAATPLSRVLQERLKQHTMNDNTGIQALLFNGVDIELLFLLRSCGSLVSVGQMTFHSLTDVQHQMMRPQLERPSVSIKRFSLAVLHVLA